jgi:hypothetical protein
MSLGAVHLAGKVCMPRALCPEVEDSTQEPKRGEATLAQNLHTALAT